MGPIPPVMITASARPRATLDRRGDPIDVVPDGLLVVGVEPTLGEGRAHEGGVGVDDLTEQELGPDGDHLNDHPVPSRS